VNKRITGPSSEREDAIAWLDWKEAHQARRDKVIFFATVIAAIAAVLAAIFSAVPLFK
jgi:hypothetical protein